MVVEGCAAKVHRAAVKSVGAAAAHRVDQDCRGLVEPWRAGQCPERSNVAEENEVGARGDQRAPDLGKGRAWRAREQMMLDVMTEVEIEPIRDPPAPDAACRAQDVRPV